MDIRSHIMRFRNDKKQNPPNRPLTRLGTFFALVLSLGGAVAVILGVYRYAEITGDLPPPVMIEILLGDLDGALLEPTKIYDHTGEDLLWKFENPGIDHRQNIHITDGRMLFYSDVPEDLIFAVLEALDPDYLSRPENFLENIWDNSPDPIPQNLVKKLLLWDEEDHLYRQLRVNILADQIIGRYGRLRTLEWFLNSAYFGNQVYGVNQAARIYFGKNLVDLDLAESVLLAGVIQYPSLNPYDAPTAAKENQENILSSMVLNGLISEVEADRAANQELAYADPEDVIALDSPAYVNYILEEAEVIVPIDRLLRGGFKIISTLDGDIQEVLECTAEIELSRLYGDVSPLDESCPGAKFLPKYTGKYLSDQDLIEFNLILHDPQSGELLAMIEVSRQAGKGKLLDPRDPGTLMTPFIYLNSFAQGFEPASLVWDIPLPESDLSADELHPACDNDCGFLGPVNMRTSMGSDYLSPSYQLWSSLGEKRIINTLSLFGLSLSDSGCSDCLIFADGSPLEIVDIAQGYGIFAAQGTLQGRSVSEYSSEVQPISIKSVEDLSNSEWVGFHPLIKKTVISEELAYLVNHALSDENARRDIKGRDVYQIGRPAGIKVGYVPGSSSGWTVGYTPQRVAVVWVGNHSGDSDFQSADYQKISGDIWRASIQYVSKDLEILDWEMPPGVIAFDVCYPSGMIPTDHCPRVVREPFIEGNEPQEIDSLYQVYEVNRETGLLASVFSPAEQIEERVYLNVPPFAEEWAAEAGVPLPPNTHDLDSNKTEVNDLKISSPENYSFVRGMVNITGTLPKDDFLSARLQYGQGMNPKSWLQIGQEITTPVSGGRLGVWNTQELDDGIYAVQLVLVRRGQQIESVSAVISVDNTPPDVRLTPDLQDQQIRYEADKELLFTADLSNLSEIQSVSFYINSELVSTRVVPPYFYSWPLTLGHVDLRVVAIDQANNQGEYTASFIVYRP